MGRIVSIDGKLLAPEQASVSVFDRGFLYGDSVYEVVRTYSGIPFELQAHLERMRRSAELIALTLEWPLSRLADEVRRTMAAGGNAESYARIMVTRGEGELGLDPGLARGQRVIVIVKELSTPGPEVYREGVKVALVGVRKNLREAIDPAAKTGNYLNNVLALKEAKASGAFEALMLDREGRVTEATTANLFTVRGGKLVTPALEVGILSGVTRSVVLGLARAAAIEAVESVVYPDDLWSADEVFITGTTRELVPVVTIVASDAVHRIAGGVPGPVTLKLLADFREHARRETEKAARG